MTIVWIILLILTGCVAFLNFAYQRYEYWSKKEIEALKEIIKNQEELIDNYKAQIENYEEIKAIYEKRDKVTMDYVKYLESCINRRTKWQN